MSKTQVWTPGVRTPMSDSAFIRRMARGHQLRTGHPLVAFYEASSTAGVWTVARECCTDEKGAE